MSAECPPDYAFPFGSSCYKIGRDRLDRSEAAAECASNEAHLVDIKSAEEQDFIETLFRDASVKEAWFGLSVHEVGGDLLWSDGSVLEFTAWAEEDRNRGRTEELYCALLSRSEDYLWVDKRGKSCEHDHKFICEFEQTEEHLEHTECPTDYSFQLVNSCYKIGRGQKVDRSAAAAECADDKAHLVDIKSAEEQDFIDTLLRGADIREAWFGLSAHEFGGDLLWSDGTVPDFTAWAINGRNEDVDCVRLKRGKDDKYEWMDKICTDQYEFLCEFEISIEGPAIPLQGKPTSQSSTHDPTRSTSDKAVDGDTNGVYSSGSCTHTLFRAE
ncbi:macrophage mannose receptor 1-like [Amphiura filiformis]|uniref:macrophage mannose receptor 1-like n=1 Tax=Amphiura filiformis TaxID=82378 RepID=UPI003B21210A